MNRFRLDLSRFLGIVWCYLVNFPANFYSVL